MADEVLDGEQKKNIHNMLLNKINDYESVICNTYISMNYYKNLKIVKPNDTNHCIHELNMLLDEVRLLQIYLKDNEDNYDVDNIINDIQVINNKLSSIIKTNGTKEIRDLINICFGQDYLEKTDKKHETKIELIEKYFHPISYKLIQHNDKKKNNSSSSSSNPILQDIRICEKGENFTFYDLENINVSSNLLKIYGMRILIQEKKNNKSLLVSGFVDDIQLDYIIGNKLILEKCYKIKENKPNSEEFFDEKFDLYLKTLNMKDYLINDNNELYDRYIGYLNNARVFKTKSLNKIVNDFIKASFVDKRLTLIQLLLFSNDNEYQYMAYLLYDSISTDDKVNDSTEQLFLFDSLPWSIKNKFKGAMKQTLEYTNNLLNYDVNNKLPLEQRICLLKTSDKVKEKAMLKLKEVKSKTDDSGTKARHYIDGLLKIPFGIFKRESIFDILDSNESAFRKIIEKEKYANLLHVSKKTTKYTSMEIIKNIKSINSALSFGDNESKMYILLQRVEKLKKKELYDCLHILKGYMNDKEIVENNDVLSMYVNMNWQNQNRNFLKEKIIFMLKEIEKNYPNLLDELISATKIIEEDKISLYNELKLINKSTNMVSTYMNNVKNILDSSVYGHDSAKRQVERIIGQWINGKETGYSLGFEGPPGVGKTSLAKKGLADCLVDDNGESRPFSFIAIGGSSNGSTLEGHNYTYVGSTWGRIVDILMEKKCMNPIIFIDEIDKVSRTESGREIISILTHLIDPTQNDNFQDKYFSGVELDLSRVLFVFSYNDVELIDKILLDRIHRIKFDHLTLDDKLVICEKHMLPEIYENMGQNGTINISKEVLEYIIEHYTYESGVRKLKEILNEIIGEINLELLKNTNVESLPINVTKDDVKYKYLKKRHEIREKEIHKDHEVGIINGLWANSLGKGGIIPIQSQFILSTNLLDLKLTGMQGDVMKESMTVAKTLAWKLISDENKTSLLEQFEKTKTQGIHIHCPDGATPKDGPSAGTAITITLYSLFTNKKIRHNLAITGEMNLQGQVTAIGGLDLKILGGMRAGVKTFLFPLENKKDYDDFVEKYGHALDLSDINFHSIETIEEAITFAILDE